MKYTKCNSKFNILSKKDALLDVFIIIKRYRLATAAFAVTGATALATFATRAVTSTVAVTTRTTVATAAATAGFLFLIAFGLREQCLAAELDLAGLVVEGDDLDLKLVAFLDEAFEGGGVGHSYSLMCIRPSLPGMWHACEHR